jgi:hypothetical protein
MTDKGLEDQCLIPDKAIFLFIVTLRPELPCQLSNEWNDKPVALR